MKLPGEVAEIVCVHWIKCNMYPKSNYCGGRRYLKATEDCKNTYWSNCGHFLIGVSNVFDVSKWNGMEWNEHLL